MAYSYRWGIDLLHRKRVLQVPVQVLECWAETGITYGEFVILLQLASFKPNRKGSRCDPSFETLGRRIGKKRAAASNLVSSLKKKGLLKVTSRTKRDQSGPDTNLYDFSPFVERCKEIWEKRQRLHAAS